MLSALRQLRYFSNTYRQNGEAICSIKDRHALIFTNFRGDRAIQFSEAILEDNFQHFERKFRPEIFTKSGLMVGLGENDDEVKIVQGDL